MEKEKDKAFRLILFSSYHRAGEEGLEPPSTVLETAALPLNYSPVYHCESLALKYTSIEQKKCQLKKIKKSVVCGFIQGKTM